MSADVTGKKENFDDLFWSDEIVPLESEWDELAHIKEQYDIKCDELLSAMLENVRLVKILFKHGLEKEVETDDGEEIERTTRGRTKGENSKARAGHSRQNAKHRNNRAR